MELPRFHVTPVSSKTNGIFDGTLETASGSLQSRLHLASGEVAIIWVFGLGGGLGGPAGGIYDRLAGRLRSSGYSSMQLDYAIKGNRDQCVIDVLRGLDYLGSLGKDKIILVGHSLGGSVVVRAAASSPAVIGVVTLSSENSGILNLIAQVSPRPLLLVHGDADTTLSPGCSRSLFARAGSPKKLIIYPDCGHGLDECRGRLDADLFAWLSAVGMLHGR